MSGLGFQLFGFVASVIGTAISVGAVYTWLRDAMPSAKMRALDALLCETETLLRSAMEEGTIDYGQYDHFFRSRIWAAKVRADRLRANVYNINGRWHELRYWLGGMSGKILAVMISLYKVRAQIAVSSSRGRERLAKLDSTANPTLEKYAIRDTVSSLLLPDPPANAALALQSCSLDEMTAIANSAVLPPVDDFNHSLTQSSPLQNPAGSFTAEPPAYSGPADCQPHESLPPLVFRPKDKATFRRTCVERFVSFPLSVSGAHKEHRGPHRIFSRFFQPPSATLPFATLPVTASLLTPPPSKKGTYLHGDLWEEDDHVSVQVQLPV